MIDRLRGITAVSRGREKAGLPLLLMPCLCVSFDLVVQNSRAVVTACLPHAISLTLLCGFNVSVQQTDTELMEEALRKISFSSSDMVHGPYSC